MDKILSILQELNLPFAYDHFAEGESPEPPFICYLIPGSDNFAADGKVYVKINEFSYRAVHRLQKPALENSVEAVLDNHSIFITNPKSGLRAKSLYEVLYTFEMEV